MVDASGKVAMALLKFGEAKDVDKMKEARAEAQRVLTDVRAELKELAEFDTPTGKKLYQAHQRLLDAYEKIIDKDLDEVIKVVEDKKLTLDEREARLREIGKRADRCEEDSLKPFQELQRKFAQENNIKLIQK